MKPSEVLQRTREVLLEKTWVNRAPEDDSTEVCLGTAHAEAYRERLNLPGFAPEQKSYGFLSAVTRTIGIHNWNDVPGRTFSEVIQAVDEAVRLAKQAEADGEY